MVPSPNSAEIIKESVSFMRVVLISSIIILIPDTDGFIIYLRSLGTLASMPIKM
jgi:hypothetical protein